MAVGQITDELGDEPPIPNPPGLASANASLAAGTASQYVVAQTGHLYSITVAPPGTGVMTSAVTITDGPVGALLAVIPANFAGGDIPLSAPRYFKSGAYATTSTTSPAFTIGYGA